MDPYRDTIPDSDREQILEIKKRVKERDGSDSEERPRKWARADTNALLPPGSSTQEVTEPPKPEEDLESYNHERLQRGLQHIDLAGKRNITPRTREFLHIYKDAYKAALDDESPLKAAQAVVQALDKVYYSAAFYFKPRSCEEHDHLTNYLKLRRLELLANYGDHLGQSLQESREKLNLAAKGGETEVQEAAQALGSKRTWSDIADELSGANMEELRKHVWVACGILGIDPNHMVRLIKEWGDRNRFFHNKIRSYITDCHFPPLAQQLCRDLKELLNVTPDLETAASYEKVLLGIQNEYFEVLDNGDPNYWLPNEKARKLIQEKILKEQKEKQKE